MEGCFPAWLFVPLLIVFAPANLRAGTPIQAWARRYNGPGNGADVARAIALDEKGNAYVTGYSIGTNGFIDYATIAYSSSGTTIWTNRYDGPAILMTKPRAIALDTNSNQVYVTGYSYVPMGTLTSPQSHMYAGIPLWTNRFNRPIASYAEARAIALGMGMSMSRGLLAGMGSDYAS